MNQLRGRLVAPSVATLAVALAVVVAVLLVLVGMVAGAAIWDVMESLGTGDVDS